MSHEPVQDIFVSEFIVHFGYPHTDSCSTWDGLMALIEAAKDSSLSTVSSKIHVCTWPLYRYNRKMSKES